MDIVRSIQRDESKQRVRNFLSQKYSYVDYYFKKLPRHVLPGDLLFVTHDDAVRGLGVIEEIFPPGCYPFKNSHPTHWWARVTHGKRITCPYTYTGSTTVPSLESLQFGFRGRYKRLAIYLGKAAKMFKRSARGARQIAAAKARAFDSLVATESTEVRSILERAASN